jgi:hypothetical protein
MKHMHQQADSLISRVVLSRPRRRPEPSDQPQRQEALVISPRKQVGRLVSRECLSSIRRLQEVDFFILQRHRYLLLSQLAQRP